MPKMIPVRSKISGLETKVSEAAFGAFAAHYVRLDTPEGETEQPAQPEAPAQASASAKSTRRGTAPKEGE